MNWSLQSPHNYLEYRTGHIEVSDHFLESAEPGLEPRSAHLLSSQHDVSLLNKATIFSGTGLSAFLEVTSFNMLKPLSGVSFLQQLTSRKVLWAKISIILRGLASYPNSANVYTRKIIFLAQTSPNPNTPIYIIALCVTGSEHNLNTMCVHSRIKILEFQIFHCFVHWKYQWYMV